MMPKCVGSCFLEENSSLCGTNDMCVAGPGLLAPLLLEMLHNIQTEVQRYERLINYWPVYAVTLEEALCFALRTVMASIFCQCGLVQSSSRTAAEGCGSNLKSR